MMSKKRFFNSLLFVSLFLVAHHCFSDFKILKKEPFKDRMGSYSKYLRATKSSQPNSLKIVRPNFNNIPQEKGNNRSSNRLRRSKLGAIQSLSLNYFRNLHSTFLNSVKIFRFWIQFLKLKPELGLKEFKIRTQQLRNAILQGSETSIQIRKQLINVNKFMEDLSQDLQNNSIQFIETPYYSKLLTSQARVNFLMNTLGFYVDHIATLQTFQLNNLVKELDSTIQRVESINTKHWEKSFKSILLKEQEVLITNIKNLTRDKLKSFKQIKQNYVYAESQILVNRDEIKSKKLPSSRKALHTEVLDYKKLQKSFQDKITKFIDQETIQFQILNHKSQQSKKWLIDNPSKAVYPLLPLANQLFNDNHNSNLNTKFSNIESSKKSMDFLNEKKQIQNNLFIQSENKFPDWI